MQYRICQVRRYDYHKRHAACAAEMPFGILARVNPPYLRLPEFGQRKIFPPPPLTYFPVDDSICVQRCMIGAANCSTDIARIKATLSNACRECPCIVYLGQPSTTRSSPGYFVGTSHRYTKVCCDRRLFHRGIFFPFMFHSSFPVQLLLVSSFRHCPLPPPR